MKRATFLFEKIIDRQNLKLALLKALRGKRRRVSVQFFAQNINGNLEKMRARFSSAEPFCKTYRQFQIHDPKPRTISAAPFSDRVMHHAMMNVLETIFERQFIFHTYACRKGKGTHRAVLALQKHARETDFFLKLDVKKFFDNINHEVLKTHLSRIIKEKRTLFLLSKIIDSYNFRAGFGLPIGNLTSQFFANFYLSPLDHFILEQLKPRFYVGYMDDLILLGKTSLEMKKLYLKIREFLSARFYLSLKTPIINRVSLGIPFLGFLIKPQKVKLLRQKWQRKKSKLRQIARLLDRNQITSDLAEKRMNAVWGVARKMK